VLMMEFWPHGLREAGVEPVAVLNELDRLGLSVQKVEAERQAEFSRDEILQIGGDDCVNLVLSRRKLV
jgi:translation elongation factor EF-G